MKKVTPAAALAALLVLSITACSSSRKVEVDPASSSVTTTSDAANTTAAQPSTAPAAESTMAPAAEPSAASAAEPNTVAAADTASHSDEDTPGAGHVSMTGDYVLENDFVVQMCQAGPPGDGLLSGYHMAIKDGDPQIVMLSIGLKNYDKDGVYEMPSLSREGAVGQAMRSGMMGPLMLMVMKPGSTQPFGFSQAHRANLRSRCRTTERKARLRLPISNRNPTCPSSICGPERCRRANALRAPSLGRAARSVASTRR